MSEPPCIFLTSPWIPPEWIKAHGLEPRGIWFDENLVLDSLPLSQGVCAFAQGVACLAESQSASAVIFSSHCDQLRRAFDATSGSCSRLFLFNLPATWQTPAAQQLFHMELKRLGRFLVELGGRCPPPADLLAISEIYCRRRQRLAAIAGHCPARVFAEAVARFHWDGYVANEDPAAPASELEDKQIPIAIIGGPLPRSHWGLLDGVERSGGKIVLNATEAGERSLISYAALRPESEPVESLANSYFAHCVDVFQRPNSKLYSWLGPRLKSRGARGILLWHFAGCDLWRAEAEALRKAFGLPVLSLDAAEAQIGTSREANRLQAFMEALR